MRCYLVVMDDGPEAQVALRFAARRAAKTGGDVEIVAAVPPPEFIAFAGVQATIEEEARARAEGLVAAAAGTILAESGLRPRITVLAGEPAEVVRQVVAADRAGERRLAALVLGGPGELVSHFTGLDAALAIPVTVVPGSLTPAEIDELS